MYATFYMLLFATFLFHLLASRISFSPGAIGARRLMLQGLPNHRGRLFRRGSLPCCAKKESAKRKTVSGGGFGAKKVAKQPVDGKVLLKRSENDFLVLEKLGKNEELFRWRDYVVSTRLKPNVNVSYEGLGMIADWVPCTELRILCAVGTELEEKMVEDAVASLAPGIFTALTNAISSVKKLSPKNVQYGFEPMDSFYDHVMPFFGVKDDSSSKMSKKEAFDIFEIDATADFATVRKAYRKLKAKFHPDANDAPDALEKYLRVEAAYTIIGASPAMTGLGWFESLGGSERQFTRLVKNRVVPVERPLDIKKHVLSGSTFAAVWPVDTELTNHFALGNLQRSL